VKPSLVCSALAGATLLLAGCANSAADKPGPGQKANIIMIMADDIGYECFGSYGSTQYHTPNLDRMAAGGIRFNHAYSQPLCTPSRVKLMTGLSNVRNYSAFSILNRDQRTFGHMLKAAGYRTMVAGKWQLFGAENYSERFRGKGTLPKDAGFDRYCLWQVDKLGSRYWKPLLNIDGENRQFPEDQYGPDIVSDYVCNFIEENRDRPFFAYYPMILVHNPFLPTPDSADRNSKDQQRNFEDMVAYMDKLVGRVVAKTEELGIADRTLILFTGDNGTNRKIKSRLGDRIIPGGKGLTIDYGTHVPLIGYWPGVIPAGQVSDELIDFTDFLPTFLELAQAPLHDGRSFLPFLKGERGQRREWLFTYYNPRPERTDPNWMGRETRYTRDQTWKLYGDGRFFNTRQDVFEKNPLTDLEPGSEAAKAREKLAAAMKTMPTKGQTLLKFAP